MLVIAIAFPLIYINLFSANFISWDDTEYVLENQDVHLFHINHFFSKSYIGNYHPITMISYAIDWKLYGKSAFSYHVENTVWHFANTILVFILCRKILKNELKAVVVALIFALHPTQIETVAWIAERKNVMATFFFLSSLILYIQFLITKKNRFIFFTFLLYFMALLCKPSVIVLPLVLFILDYFYNEPILKKNIFQKIPFIILAIAFGIVTYITQQSGKFINESHAYPISERIGYAGYAITQYLSKLFFPVNLSVIYPYPTNKTISVIFGYIALIILGIVVYKLYKAKKNTVLFGLLFFIINLLLVLQFIPFGEVLTADRYLYIPIIGISITLISLFSFKEKQLKIISITLLLVFGSLSFLRSKVWQNSISLFNDTYKKQPHSFVVLNSLGAEYMLAKNYSMANKYLNMAINENTNYYKGYYNRGLLYAQTNRFDKALADFNRAIELKKYPKAYVARANVYYALKDFPKALADAEEVLKTEPLNAKANYVLATCYDDLNQLDKALIYYNKAITAYTEEPLYFMRRGILYGKQQNFSACLVDLNTCTTINPNFAEAYYWKGVAKVNLKQNPCADLKAAVNLGFIAAQQSIAIYCK